MKYRILFEINHPKHFHQFKHVFRLLRSDCEIKIIARDKDVVLDLLNDSGYDFEEFGMNTKGLGEKVFSVPRILARYNQIVKKFKPDLIVSRSSPFAALVSLGKKYKTVVFPDSEVVMLNNRFTIPLSDYVITPSTYQLNHGKNHFRLNGFFENAYLDPKYFKHDPTVLDDAGLSKNEKYFILRFVGWNANHDLRHSGFTVNQKFELVTNLSPYGKVFISSESKLPEELLPYKVNINPSKMHSLLYTASLYIGDSQTMATEASLLGTPAIRYNTFVGSNDMSNFINLEQKFGLLKSVDTYEKVVENAISMLQNPTGKQDHMEKASLYFKQSGDINTATVDYLMSILKS